MQIERADVGVEEGDIGIDLDCLFQQIDGRVVLAVRCRDAGEQLEGFGMIGLVGEELAIDGFGFAQAAGALMGEADFQSLPVGHLDLCASSPVTFAITLGQSPWAGWRKILAWDTRGNRFGFPSIANRGRMGGAARRVCPLLRPGERRKYRRR